MERVSILIDGSNFYHLVLKKLGLKELQFDFEKFAEFLANGRIISDMGKRFYTGTVREKEGDIRSKEVMAKQTSLFTVLKDNHWEIKTSKLQTRTEEISIDNRVVDYENILKLGIKKIKFEKLREKGIDVKLATDSLIAKTDIKRILIKSDLQPFIIHTLFDGKI